MTTEPHGDRPGDCPLVTGELPGVGGTLKSRPEDFQVRERPLYELEGDGPHLYFSVTKRGMTTSDVIQALANHMDVSPDRIGYAGRKDAGAVTTQRMSLEHADEDRLTGFEHSRVDLSILGWHRNKLQPGHLAGNDFRVKLRDTHEVELEQLDSIVETLRSTGVPHYFGSQRFGRRGDTARLGKLMVTDELETFLDAYFGRPDEQADPEAVYHARSAYERGELETAMDHWPGNYGIKRRALATYIDRHDPKPVLSSIPKSRRQLFVSAFQSQLFNEQVARRIDSLAVVHEGGIAKKTDTGGMFRVEDEQAEQIRATNFKISPTGALPGEDLWEAKGKQGELEREILTGHGLSLEDFGKVAYLGASGSRRPLRFKAEQLTWQTGSDQHGDYLQVSFFAPSGCYATVLLRELMGPS